MKVLIFILLIGIAFQAKVRKEHEEIYSSLAEIGKSPFGNAVLNLLSLNMKTKQSSIQAIKDLINEIRQSLLDAQERDDITIAAQRQECESTKSSLNTEISNAKNTINEANERIETNQGLIISKTSDKDSATKSQSDAEEGKEETIKQDAIDTEKFNINKKNLEDAIVACDDALNIVANFKFSADAASFIQLSSNLNSLSKIKSKVASKYQPLIETVTILAQKVDKDTVEKLVNLVNQLKDMLRSELNQLITNNDFRVQNVALQIENFENTIAEMITKIRILENEIIGLNSDISRDEGLIEETTKYLEVKQQQLDDEILLCQQQEDEYENITNDRDGELRLLNTLDEYFTKKTQGMSEFLKSQLE